MQPLPTDMQERIGQTRRRRFEVTLRDIRRFAQAIGEPAPLPQVRAAGCCDDPCCDSPCSQTEDGARACVEAPALFCQVMMYEDAEPGELPPDGAPLEIDIGLPNACTVGGSSDFRIGRPVRAGDVIDVESTVTDIRVKEGRSGRLYLVSVQTRFTDAKHQEVACELATYIQRS